MPGPPNISNSNRQQQACLGLAFRVTTDINRSSSARPISALGVRALRGRCPGLSDHRRDGPRDFLGCSRFAARFGGLLSAAFPLAARGPGAAGSRPRLVSCVRLDPVVRPPGCSYPWTAWCTVFTATSAIGTGHQRLGRPRGCGRGRRLRRVLGGMGARIWRRRRMESQPGAPPLVRYCCCIARPSVTGMYSGTIRAAANGCTWALLYHRITWLGRGKWSGCPPPSDWFAVHRRHFRLRDRHRGPNPDGRDCSQPPWHNGRGGSPSPYRKADRVPAGACRIGKPHPPRPTIIPQLVTTSFRGRVWCTAQPAKRHGRLPTNSSWQFGVPHWRSLQGTPR